MKVKRPIIPSRVKFAPMLSVLGLTLLAGCVPATTGALEGIGFRQARFQEISAMRSYRTCVEDALKVAVDAKRSGSPAAYRTSAKILEKCEADLGPEVVSLAQEERMRAYAVSILNYIKAGDLARAQRNLKTFKSSFVGYDLYLADGSSFTDTADLLTGNTKFTAPQNLAMFNVSQDLHMEVQRVHFWKRN